MNTRVEDALFLHNQFDSLAGVFMCLLYPAEEVRGSAVCLAGIVTLGEEAEGDEGHDF